MEYCDDGMKCRSVHVIRKLVIIWDALVPKQNTNIFLNLSSFPSGHEFRPTNDLFRPHDCVRLVVPLTVVQVFVFR
jgi:hypothetical protein